MLKERFLACALLAVVLSLTGCGESRSKGHAEQAQQLLAEGQLDKALIELNSALRLDPENANYSHLIAELLMVKGKAREARFYYGEAYRLDPKRFEAAIRLATLQFAVRPDESRALIEEIVASGPESAWGAIGESEQALYYHDVDAAIERAQHAAKVEPTNADAHWQIAVTKSARIHELTQIRHPAPDALFEETLAALDQFAKYDSARRWRAVAERARIYTAWAGHSDEARASLHEASDLLGELGLTNWEFRILDRAIDYARAHDDAALEEWAIERKIERIPDLYPAWDDLAALYHRTGRPASIVYNRLMAAFPEATEPRIFHARFVREHRGRRRAIKLLERYIDEGFDEAQLLAEIAKNQSLLGRRQDSLQTIAKLEAKYPDSRESVVMAAFGWLQAGKPSLAIAVLAEHAWTADDVAAQRLLVDARSLTGDTAGIVEAVERLLELMPEPDLATRRRHAQALFDDGQYHAARDVYRTLQSTTALTGDDVVRYAVTLFETSAHAIGRSMLEHAVDLPAPSRLAVSALYQREGAGERNRDRVRRGFAKLIEAAPNDRELLTEYVRFEIEADAPRNALPPLDRSIATARRAGQPLAQLLSLQASLQDATGDHEAARKTAIEVLDLAPRLPGALEFAQKLYPTAADARKAIAELTAGVEPEDHKAPRHALLGRLYYRAGNTVMARWSYEQALSGGLELPILKNDLAFLLALQKRDLKRAKVLALQASQALPNESGVLDTLGFVLLQLEDFPNASENLRRGIEIAERNGSPRAELHYHLGLALSGLGRINEAEAAFATALSLGETFPDEAAAATRLATIRGEILPKRN